MILDIRMPGMSGLELMDKLPGRKISVPVIILTGHGDVRMAVQAMQKGAVDFFEKPFRDQELIDCVQKALEADVKALEAKVQGRRLDKRVDRLTPREREVLGLVLNGISNKKIAESLGLSPKTVEVHRSHILQKMQANSAVHLVSMFLTKPVALSS